MRPLTRLCCSLALVGTVWGLAASELVDELVLEVREQAEATGGLDAPVVYARQLAATDPDEWGLDEQEIKELHLAQAAAWLAVSDPEAAAVSFQVIGDPAQWDEAWAARAALIASALIDADLLPEATVEVIQAGVWPAEVQVAVTSAATRRLLRQQDYQAAADQVLAGVGQLMEQDPRWRTPLYALWLLSQEKLGRDVGAIQRDLAAFKDPATDQLADTLAGSSILGQPFPDLPLFRLGEKVHEPTTVANELAGRPTVVVVGALWHAESVLFAEAVSAAVPENWSFFFLVMDQRDVLGDLGAAAKVARIVGDLRGWDSEFDEALQVDVFPAWLIVDRGGIIRAMAPADPKNPVQDVPQVSAALLDVMQQAEAAPEGPAAAE